MTGAVNTLEKQETSLSEVLYFAEALLDLFKICKVGKSQP